MEKVFDDLEGKILRMIQISFPITKRPFAEIGKRIGVDEKLVLRKVKELKEKGVIRDICGVFELRKLGFFSVLCAMKIEKSPNFETKVSTLKKLFDVHPGISHAYLRDVRIENPEGETSESIVKYNLWLTLTSRSFSDVLDDIKFIADFVGLKNFVIFPTEKKIKLTGVFEKDGVFDYEEEKRFHLLSTDENGFKKEFSRDAFFFPKNGNFHSQRYFWGLDNLKIPFEKLGALEEDIKIVPEPFDKICEKWRISLEELSYLKENLEKLGILRRYGATLRHVKVGYRSNALLAWMTDFPDELGAKFQKLKFVSHCIKRQPHQTFPFCLFTMIHARDDTELEIEIQIMKSVGEGLWKSLTVMRTIREIKKAKTKIFSPLWETWRNLKEKACFAW